MSDSDSEPDPLAALAEEFAGRYRRGERPSLTEYTERYPGHAERIRRLFPALAVMEEFGSVAGPVARLAWMLSADSDHRSHARYLLSAQVFLGLAGRGVEAIVTDSVLLVPPGSLYFQRLLGFRPVTVTVTLAEPTR